MSVVYVMKIENKNVFKVGYCSTEIEQRLKNVRVGCPYPLYLYATISCEANRKLERKIQSMLTQTETKGEWYDVSLETINTILMQFPNVEFCSKKHRYFDEGIRERKSVSQWKSKTRNAAPKISKKRKTKGPRIKKCKRPGCENKTLGRRRLYCSDACGNAMRQRRCRERKKDVTQ